MPSFSRVFVAAAAALAAAGGVVVEAEVAEVDAKSGEVASADAPAADANRSSANGLFSDIFAPSADWTAVSSLAKSIMSSIGGTSPTTDDDAEAAGGSDESLDTILAAARDMAAQYHATRPGRTLPQLIEHFKTHFLESQAMVTEAFAHVDFSKLSLAALWYYVEKTEQERTPSWKRRVHRFHERVDVDTILELHDALHLMQIAYLPNEELIRQEVHNFRNGTYEVVYAVTTGHATEPAHFAMIPKVETKAMEQEKSKNGKSVLEIVIALRGSGDPGDFVSDSMMNATAYRSGKAHDGLARSGKFVADFHVAKIRELWKVSGRDRVKVILVGYSLGAGVAAIAAMELNDYDFIDAQAITFGCPALLDLEQSIGTKDYITSIVSDADIISRMSGATIGNMFLDLLSYDWTDVALMDLGLLLDHVGKSLPIDKDTVMKWANDTLTKKYRPHFSTIPAERAETELYPPGNCVHLWRNGAGWSATHTPCQFFDSVEFSRTLIDDHLLEPGYHPALLALVRETKGQNFQFEHDLVAVGKLTKSVSSLILG